MRNFARNAPVGFSIILAGAVLFISVMLSPIAVQEHNYWLDEYAGFSFIIILGILSIGQFRAARISANRKKKARAVLHNFTGVILAICIIVLAIGVIMRITEGY